jgi:hypothetical protein
MAEVAVVKVAAALAGPAITQIISELGRVAYCLSEAKKLRQLLEKWVGPGDIARRILALPPSKQSDFEKELWAFQDALEDAEDVIQSALQLRWYQLWERHQHSRQLASVRERLEGILDLNFQKRLEVVAEEAREAAGAAITAAAVSGRPGGSRGQQGSADVSCIFEHTEGLIPKLKAELSAPGGKRNMALLGMPGLGKTTIARRLFQELQPAFGAALFMTVSKTPYQYGLLKQAGKELLGMTEFPFMTAEALRDDLMEELRGKKVLLVLDDVWTADHLEDLNFATGTLRAGQVRHEGSRLLVTTRDRGVLRVLENQESISVREPPLLTPPYDQQLLCFHAFSDSQPKLPDGWMPVVEGVVTACKANPLLLRVTGGGLREKALGEWKQRLEKFKETGSRLGDEAGRQVLELCRPSYADLDLVARECFKLFAAFPEDHTFEVLSLRDRPLGFVHLNVRHLVGQA